MTVLAHRYSAEPRSRGVGIREFGNGVVVVVVNIYYLLTYGIPEFPARQFGNGSPNSGFGNGPDCLPDPLSKKKLRRHRKFCRSPRADRMRGQPAAHKKTALWLQFDARTRERPQGFGSAVSLYQDEVKANESQSRCKAPKDRCEHVILYREPETTSSFRALNFKSRSIYQSKFLFEKFIASSDPPNLARPTGDEPPIARTIMNHQSGKAVETGQIRMAGEDRSFVSEDDGARTRNLRRDRPVL